MACAGRTNQGATPLNTSRASARKDSGFFVEQITRPVWLLSMHQTWRQGEHALLLGMTGSGKTTLARDLLPARRYVAAFAVKRFDDTLDTFAGAGYKRTAWPPSYNVERALFWPKPADLDDISSQRVKVRAAINDIFKNGGWSPFFDDVGYMAGPLGLGKEIAVLLSLGRSSHISVTCAATQPTSMTQRIPTEVWRQVSHLVAFAYHNDRDTRTVAEIMGYDHKTIRAIFDMLGPFDFLASSHGRLTIVRAT